MAERTTALKIMVALDAIGGNLLVLIGLTMIFVGVVTTSSTGSSVTVSYSLDGLFGILYVVFGFLILIVGALGLVLAWGLWNMKPWARILATIFYVIGLVGFPIGTIIGIIFIYFLWVDAKTKALFG